MSELHSNQRAAMKLLGIGARRGLAAVAISLQGEAKRTVNTRGSGRLYRRSKNRVHQASAPGEPPAKDTGHLSRSIQVDLSKLESKMRARMGTNVNYGRYLEYGTRHMAARPWMRPTLSGMRSRIPDIMRKEIKRIIPDLRRLRA